MELLPWRDFHTLHSVKFSLSEVETALPWMDKKKSRWRILRRISTDTIFETDFVWERKLKSFQFKKVLRWGLHPWNSKHGYKQNGHNLKPELPNHFYYPLGPAHWIVKGHFQDEQWNSNYLPHCEPEFWAPKLSTPIYTWLSSHCCEFPSTWNL